MKIRVLGTGTSQGVPVIGCHCSVCQSTDPRDKRQRASIYIETDQLRLLVDIGPDFRAQMLQSGLSDIDAVFITHEHNDHTAGVDDIRPLNFLQKRNMPFYTLARVAKEIKKRFHYAFAEVKYPGAPQLEMVEVTEEAFYINNQKIQPILVLHGQLPILGLRVGRFAYLTDVKTIPESEMLKLEDLDVLIISALRHEPHYSHLTLEEALALSRRIGAQRTYFTHMSHKLGKHEEVERHLPDGIRLAYDGLSIVC